jgi:peptidyl-prolyl cis-trans isomerase A (cyclophilin A)
MCKLRFIIILLLLFVIPFSLSARHFARWYTTMGSFTSDLRDEIVPITANNFIDLTNSGFYDGLHFHRVIDGFVIQDGDPLGTGYGGPGYTIPDEFSDELFHDSAGVLAMAHSAAPNSAGSQYYITLAATPWLDGNYAIFGKVFEGLEVVLNIGHVPVDANDHPVTNVVIDSLRILDLVINNASPNPDSTVMYDMENPAPFVVEAYNDDFTVLYRWYVDGVLVPDLADFMFQPVLNDGNHTVACETSTTELSWTTTWQVNVYNSTSAADPQNHSVPLSIRKIAPNPFHTGTTINYTSKANQPVFVQIYDSKGRRIRSESIPGSTSQSNSWTWDGKDANSQSLPTGIYFVQIQSGSQSHTKRCLLIK